MIWFLLGACLAFADEPSEEEESDDAGWGEEDDDWGGSDSVGFGETPAEPEKEKWTDWFTFGGTYRSDNALWLQRLETEPVASVRHWLDLSLRFKKGIFLAEAAVHGEVDLVYLIQRDRYDDATFDTYGWQVAPRELYLDITPGDLFLISLGRQVVAWGEGLILSPLDVVSPRDYRDPGVADLDELRLPIGMIRFGVFPENQRFEVMLVPEPFYGYRATPAGPFGAIDDLLAESDMSGALDGKTLWWDTVQDHFSFEWLEAFVRWRYRGAGWDLAFYGGSTLDDAGILVLPDPEALQDEDIYIGVDHLRYTLIGTSGNALVAPPVLLRWELAFNIGREFAVGDVTLPTPVIDTETRTLMVGMAGVEYTGIPRTSLLLEVQVPGFLGNGLWSTAQDLPPLRPQNLLFPVDTETIAIRATHHELRERLKFSAMALLFGIDARNGAEVWADGFYEFADGMKAGAQVILPFSTDTKGPMYGLDDHFRLYARLRIDF